jgi:hypothetical protein
MSARTIQGFIHNLSAQAKAYLAGGHDPEIGEHPITEVLPNISQANLQAVNNGLASGLEPKRRLRESFVARMARIS